VKPKFHGGDNVTKRTWHLRVEDARGKANKYMCIDCGKQAQDWTQKTDTDGRDIYGHYDPRCKKCHWRYDEHLHVIGPGGPSLVHGEQNGASKLTEDDVREIRELLKSKQLTQWQIASIYGVKQMAISNIHTGKTWKWLI
jgi:hypothetical protein